MFLKCDNLREKRKIFITGFISIFTIVFVHLGSDLLLTPGGIYLLKDIIIMYNLHTYHIRETHSIMCALKH